MRLYSVFLWFCFLSFFFCQPHNQMYLRAPSTNFNETWSQWSMTQPACVIWPLTGSKVTQGHRGQKKLFFSLKSLLLLQITDNIDIICTYESPLASVAWVDKDLGSKVILGHFRCLEKWGQMSIFSYIWASGGTSRTIIGYLIEHSMDSRFKVNFTPKVKVYGSKVKFSTRSYGYEIWHG